LLYCTPSSHSSCQTSAPNVGNSGSSIRPNSRTLKVLASQQKGYKSFRFRLKKEKEQDKLETWNFTKAKQILNTVMAYVMKRNTVRRLQAVKMNSWFSQNTV
jgi:hypothetical protein